MRDDSMRRGDVDTDEAPRARVKSAEPALGATRPRGAGARDASLSPPAHRNGGSSEAGSVSSFAKKGRASSTSEARPPDLAASLAKPRGKPRSRSSVVSRAKLRQPSLSAADKPLNTHSPIAVAAAAAVTSERIRWLLATQGPLPIRHITSHLAATIPGFGELSLSKQRRLIIAVLDAPRSEFVKVGWGRWAVAGAEADADAGAGDGPAAVHQRAASHSRALGRAGANGLVTHRESISAQLPNSKPPLSPSLKPVDDSAVFSDSDSDSDLDESEVEGTDEEDWRSIGPAGLRQTSPREQDAIAALVQLRSV